METTQSSDSQAATASSDGITKEKLVEVVTAVVFESGILSKLVDRHLEQKLDEAATKTVREYVKSEMPKAVAGSVTQVLNSDQVKELIDSKFRAIMLYLKSDVIPKVVKQTLAKSGN